jgi:ATP-dependent RNA helicase DDX51/DBP6
MIVCDSSLKPLIFFHLLHAHGVTNALVFTKSTEFTTRLVRLLDFFERTRALAAANGPVPVVARAYSSDLGAGERKSILEKFKAQEIQMYIYAQIHLAELTSPHSLVCSDLISRGIDISHVSHVVSYDVPVDMRKYVHRVGRTARAGRDGDAWTLVEEQEVTFFLSQSLELMRLPRLDTSRPC